MASLPKEELSRYAHSPVHRAVSRKDYVSLRQIIDGLPKLSEGGTIYTEEDAIAEEQRAEVLSKELDRRDVLGRETPLHLAVRMHDAVAVEILLASGADPNLQNEQGWSALQEAICARGEAIACLMTKYYPLLAWTKWSRRVPRVVGTMKRMIDFYMEVSFHFESSLIPFIGKIMPSDTYRIWKKGSNLRADMTLAGFDGWRIQRSDQSVVFIGERSDTENPPGWSLYILKHAKKCVLDALEGAGRRPSESEAACKVAELSRTNMYRPGLDITHAILMPQLTWRRQERADMVGKWKTKVYDMHHVQLTVKSRRVPGALTDEELFGTGEHDFENGEPLEGVAELLDEEKRRQLGMALDMEMEEENDTISYDARHDIRGETLSSKGPDTAGCASFVANADLNSESDKHHKALNMENRGVGDGNLHTARGSIHVVDLSSKSTGDTTRVSSSSDIDCIMYRDKGKLGCNQGTHPLRMAYSDAETKGNLLGDGDTESLSLQNVAVPIATRQLPESTVEGINGKSKDNVDMFVETGQQTESSVEDFNGKSEDTNSKVCLTDTGYKENEYTMGLRPVLWLTPNFPLKTEDILPLLDILANKEKIVSRLRDLLTTKLPEGTFPVKVAIPVIPTIKVIIAFTKFEQLRGNEAFEDPRGEEIDNHGSSWFSSRRKEATSKVVEMPGISKNSVQEAFDPFAIPDDYVWMSNVPKKQCWDSQAHSF